MQHLKEKAVNLRKLKKSYNEISIELGIPKSTLSHWFRNESWSTLIREEIILRSKENMHDRIDQLAIINKKRWENWRENYRREAFTEYEKIKNNPLFVSGINLYWGEGDSVLKNGVVRLANRDYRMIIVFNNFLQNICKVPNEKILIWLLLYPDNNEIKCKNFWSSKTGIPNNQFRKTQVINGKHPKNRLENGICTIYVSSRGLKEKIMVWTELLYKDLK
ncbi:MAG: hypothetical protein UT66_C0009G0004 [candidate division CPR2 bacterium GW2011_GWC1_39_9]|uniref:Uncharacterized protein n=1 Tax=candidate division CPR2 bacterium GW2011_GWC2_39_10 TaxID=1618345 RepID=A0A0G0LVK3_UNCC2|nr:MAG: hypothetical protein UT18_C0004G0009 [candidate division CPR2 bacterium GW2011_GWC2_39_10]KKR35641.1 MAG: hypothetical protein UT66_C0009G0004 [candidate division CPR2 bacterium GW2011_GWC1_39_9]